MWLEKCLSHVYVRQSLLILILWLIWSWFRKLSSKKCWHFNNTCIWKRPSKFDSQCHGSFSLLVVLDPTNMTYKPTPKTSKAVPNRNISARIHAWSNTCILLILWSEQNNQNVHDTGYKLKLDRIWKWITNYDYKPMASMSRCTRCPWSTNLLDNIWKYCAYDSITRRQPCI